MALEMSNATYGRSESGRKTVVANLQGDIKKVKEMLSSDSSEAKEMFKILAANWQGTDKDKFASLLKTRMKDARDLCDKYIKTLENAFTTDAKGFASTQSTIASSLNK